MASSSSAPVPSQFGVATTASQVPSAPASSLPSVPSAPTPMYKNQLQEFAQRSAVAVPVYETVNEGQQHAPKFRSTVTVDGMRFTSKLTFTQRKAAEQETARIALECVIKKIREDGYSFALKNAILCKAILNEYAAKLNKEKPTFNTVRHEGPLPVFVSSLNFNGAIYTGDVARNKKDAEQSAAHTALLSILGNPNSGLMIFHMIKSKSKFYDVVKTKSLQPVISSGLLPIANAANSSVVVDHKAVDSSVVVNHKDEEEVAHPMDDTNNNEVVKVGIPQSCAVQSTCQQSQIPKQEPVLEATIPGNVCDQPAPALPIEESSALSIEDGSNTKKRRKNNRKANKKARLEAELAPVAAVPVSRAPSCSVAQ